MENKLIHNMPDTEYFATDAASNSTLGRMKRSAAHCKEYMDTGMVSTAAMKFGSLVHCLVLEPNEFEAKYAVAPVGIDRRTKAGKELWATFTNESEGLEVVKAEDFEEAQKVDASVRAHPAASKLLQEGDAEVSMFWTDPDTGYPCKSRVDFINGMNYLVDLKTTQDASEAEFGRSIGKFGYHRQNAMYMDGYEAVTGERAKGFVFIAVETKPPYAVGVYLLDEDSEDKGRSEYGWLLGEFVACKKSGVWPGYSDAVSTVKLPAWYK